MQTRNFCFLGRNFLRKIFTEYTESMPFVSLAVAEKVDGETLRKERPQYV